MSTILKVQNGSYVNCLLPIIIIIKYNYYGKCVSPKMDGRATLLYRRLLHYIVGV